MESLIFGRINKFVVDHTQTLGVTALLMIEDFTAIVLFAKPPTLDAGALGEAVSALEPGKAATANPAADGTVKLECGGASVHISAHKGAMPDEAAVSSIGMADLPEADAIRYASHAAHVIIQCNNAVGDPMARIILLLKCGMVLCAGGGWAMCLPSSGLCVPAEDLAQIIQMNETGPRVWGLEEAEGALPGYQPRHLWECLREEAQPAKLLVGFVPAEVEHSTWFFSAGHSLFGIPEIAYSDGSLEDFPTIRELFRFIFPYFYLNPAELKPGKVVRTSDSELTISVHALPERFAELQASTGTVRVRLVSATEADSEWDS